MRKKTLGVIMAVMLTIVNLSAQRPMENLDRALVALETNNGIFLSWRMLGTDSANIGFNLYRNGVKMNANPITDKTNYMDNAGNKIAMYQVETIHENADNKLSPQVSVWPLHAAKYNTSKAPVPFKSIPLPAPPLVEGVEFTPGEMSVGDLNGDGSYELVFEWEPSVLWGSFLEAIDLDGNSLWRISAGPNTTRAKLNFLVYDLNLDGKAEVTFLSGPGTIDGIGNYISRGPAADYDPNLIIPRISGNLMEDPQFITVFDGETGVEMATTEHLPRIGPRAIHNQTWGDDRGHRASSLKGAVLYNKELGPLLVYQRGVYTRIGVAAHKWDGAHELSTVWSFDSNDTGNGAWHGQGNHTVSVGDLDGDGNDEYIIGAAAIDHDGTGLWATGFGHGDANHLGDHDPDNPGLEFFMPHENNVHGASMVDAATGEVLFYKPSPADIGRAWAEHVHPDYRGSILNPIGFPNYDCKGNEIPTSFNPYDQLVYFDGEVERDTRSNEKINSYKLGRILTGWYYGAETIHGTKGDANLVADILGDWREEMIFKHSNTELLLFSSWIPTKRKNYTLMHDPTYRMAVAKQNVGYNQPAHVGYYFPDGAPVPNIYLVERDVSAMSYGNFYLQPVHSSLSVDTLGGLSQQEFTGSGEQVWRLTRQDSVFEIYSYSANQYLGYDTTEAGSKIILTDEGSKRWFRVVKDDEQDFYYLLSNDNDSLTVAVKDTSLNVGGELVLVELSNADHKKFRLVSAGNKLDCNEDWEGTAFLDNCAVCVAGETGKFPITENFINGYYRIKTAGSGLCFTPGENIHLNTCNDDTTQIWEILRNGKYFTISSVDSAKFIKYSGGNLYLETAKANASLFRIEEVIVDQDTSYVLATPDTESVLGLTDSTPEEGSVLSMLLRAEAGNQMFILEKLNIDLNDCLGVWKGSAYTDGCGTCVGGSSGKLPCADLTEEYYRIKPRHSNLCIETKLTYPTQEGCISNLNSQLWKLERQDDGSYKILNAGTHNYLLVSTATEGEHILLSDNTSANFFITGPLVGSNTYTINPTKNPNMYVDVSSNSKDPGTRLLLWSYTGNDNQKFLLIPDTPTSIDEHKQSETNVILYPNPFEDNFNIVLDQVINNAKYELYNIEGNLMATNKISAKTTTVQIDTLPSGLYMIRIYNDKKVYNFKISKI